MAAVDITSFFGQSLDDFTIGETLSSVIETLTRKAQHTKAQVLYDRAAPCGNDIIVLVHYTRSDSFLLKFDPALQILRSITYILPETVKANQRFHLNGSVSTSFKDSLSIPDIKDLLGQPLNEVRVGKGNQEMILVYSGVSFVFKQKNSSSRLAEIRVAPSTSSELWQRIPLAVRNLHDLCLPQIQLVVDGTSKVVTGLQVTWRSHDLPHDLCNSVSVICGQRATEKPVTVMFGDQYQDIVSKLGTPDGHYYKDDHHYQHLGVPTTGRRVCANDLVLNYFALGLDMILDSRTNRVTKFAMHTNVPDHRDFSTYSRCFFKFSITKTAFSAIEESDEDSLIVCPDTNWKIIQLSVQQECIHKLKDVLCTPSTNSVYPHPRVSIYSLFDQLLVETTTSDCLAALVLLAPPSSVISASTYEYKQLEMSEPQSIREADISFTVKVPIKALEATCRVSPEQVEDDAFHSAQSSLTDITQSQPDSANDSATSRASAELRVGDFTTVCVTKKAFYGPNVNVVGVSSDDATSSSSCEPTPATLFTYEFHDDEGEMNPVTDGTDDVTVVHSSPSLTITSQLYNGKSVDHTPTSSLVTPEMESYDFITDSEAMESLHATGTVGSHKISDTSNKTSLMQSEEDTSEPQPPCKPEFQYKPQGLNTSKHQMLTSSRVLALSEDTNILPSSDTFNDKSTSTESKLFKLNNSPPGDRAQRRTVSSLSTREEARKRLMSHTKSSQQRVTQKYVDTKRAVEATAKDSEQGMHEHPDLDHGESNPDLKISSCAIEVEGMRTLNGSSEGPFQKSQSSTSSNSSHTGSTEDGVLSHQSIHHSQPVENDLSSDHHINAPLQDLPSEDGHTSTPNVPSSSVLSSGNHTEMSESQSGDTTIQSCDLNHNRDIADTVDENGTISDRGSPLNPRKHWEDGESFLAGYGPPSMNQERVLLELITCDHEEVCDKLKQRKEVLLHIWEMIRSPGIKIDLSQLPELNDEVLLCDLVSGINLRRIWTLELSAVLLPILQTIVRNNSNGRHLTVVCQAVLHVVEIHSSILLRYRAGCVTLFTPEELSQCHVCCSALEEVAERVHQLEHSDYEVLKLLKEVDTALEKLLGFV